MLVVIASNNKTLQRQYRGVIYHFCAQRMWKVSCYTVTSGAQLERKLAHCSAMPELILMDEQLADCDGFAMARRLRECQPEYTGLLVFFHASPKRMSEAFDVHAFHYIVVNESLERRQRILQMALDTVQCKTKSQQEDQQAQFGLYVQVRKGGVQYIDISAIEYVKVHRRILEVHCVDTCLETYGKLEEIFTQLQPYGFLRIHRATVVRNTCVDSMKRGTIVLSNGTQLKTGRTYEATVHAALAARLSSQMAAETAALRRVSAPARVISPPDEKI